MSYVTFAGLVRFAGETIEPIELPRHALRTLPVRGCQGCGATEWEDGACSYCRRPRFHRDDVARAGAHLPELAS